MKAWLYAGAGLALAIGLMLGMTLRPRHGGGDVPQAPVQTPVAVATAPRPAATPVHEGRAAPRPHDELPHYRLGKDLRRLASAAAGPSTPILPDPQNYYFSPLDRPPPADAAATGAAVDASALAAADGGPPTTLPVVDNEATPEAAGDTRIDR